jgi:DNA-binding HxlR family transcriptional regulator
MYAADSSCTPPRAADLLGGRWTSVLVRELLGGSKRFNALHRAVPGMSSSLLAQRLRGLEQHGLVRRTACGKVWIYGLTDAGEALRPVFGALDQWDARWTAGTRPPH